MPLLRNKFPAVPPTPYAELRPQLRSGDVLLCSGTGIFSTLIQRATRSVWSHVGLIMRLDSIDRVMVLESLEPVGVRTVRLSKYLTNYNNDGRPYPGRLAVIRHQEIDALSAEAAGDRRCAAEMGNRSADLRIGRGEGGAEPPASPPQADAEIGAPFSFGPAEAPQALTALATAAVDRFGYPYDKEQIAIIAARIAAGRLRFSRKEREKLVRPDAYICSEYVALCFEEIGIEIPWDQKGFIAPADFACADCFELVGTL
ncbi:MAG: hypothetical protein JJU05_19345 [Verrucomicrobia bacterium]|nr:hypothetical protein [Verrucomicrobiota bacterium]